MKFLTISICWLLLVLVLATPLLSDTKGKLTGTVKNQDTGEPLGNVEITILDTPKKAFTDETGQYFVLNLRPGFYDVQGFYLGFVPVIARNVFISSEHTTRINFSLSATIIEIGKTLIQHQGRPVIRKNQTQSIREYTINDLEVLPMEQFQDFLNYFPGVTKGKISGYHLRGGRTNDLLFIIDGLPVNEPFRNDLTTDVLLEDIHEVIFKSGAFSAEYGQVGSGVVQVLTRQIPTNKYSGGFAYQSGDFLTTHRDLFSEETSSFGGFNNWQVEGKFAGPFPRYLSDKLFFTLSTRYWKNDGHLYGRDLFSPQGQPKPDTSTYISFNPHNQFTLNFEMRYHLKTGFLLEYKSNYRYQKWQNYQNQTDHRWYYLPDSRRWNYAQGNHHFLKLSHEISPRVYYTLSTGYSWNQNRSYVFEQSNDPNYEWSGFLETDSLREFYVQGTDNYRKIENSNTLLSKFDLSAQLGNHNFLRTGIDFKRHEVAYHQYYVEKDRDERDDNRDGIIGNFGINPDSLDNQYHHQPMEFAFYLQDKIEWQPAAINLGLRFDYFQPDAEFRTSIWDTSAAGTSQAKGKFSISPRLSVAYNISEQGKLFASYGHFYQIPPYWGLYDNPEYRVYSSRYLSRIGNGDMELQKTISYEIGLEHQVTNNSAARIKWFYRDFRNMIGRRVFVSPNGHLYAAQWDAADFGFSQGVIVRFNQQFSKTISIDFDYTYQHTKMNNSQPSPEAVISRYDFQRRSFTSFYVADWEQPHCFQAHFYWSKPNSWGSSLHTRIESGLPYTESSYDPLKNTATYNNCRGPLHLNVDFIAFKAFPIWLGHRQTQLKLELKIYNLLDRLNEKSVWPSSGQSDRPIEIMQAGKSAQWMSHSFRYAKPREILLGLRYSF